MDVEDTGVTAVVGDQLVEGVGVAIVLEEVVAHHLALAPGFGDTASARPRRGSRREPGARGRSVTWSRRPLTRRCRQKRPGCSSASKVFLRSIPPAYPVSVPSAPMTR